MGPALTTLDIMLPATSSVLFNIPRLAEDGMNWITYKERLLTTISARGLMRYTNGRTKQPLAFKLDPTGKKLLKEDSTVFFQLLAHDHVITHDQSCYISGSQLGIRCDQ